MYNSNLYDELFHRFREQSEIIQTQEKENIIKAAKIISDAVANKKCVYIYDRGHLIGSELIARSGGVAFIREFKMSIPNPTFGGMAGTPKSRMPKTTSDSLFDWEKKFIDSYSNYTLNKNGLCEGDVLIINSVSGKSYIPIALMQEAKKMGIKLIVMTSLITAEKVVLQYGTVKLTDLADLVLDNHIDMGDATFSLDDLSEKLIPFSGISAAYTSWAIILLSVEMLIEKGISPTVYRSVNIDGGREQNDYAIKRYEENLY